MYSSKVGEVTKEIQFLCHNNKARLLRGRREKGREGEGRREGGGRRGEGRREKEGGRREGEIATWAKCQSPSHTCCNPSPVLERRFPVARKYSIP